jgi:putative MATE family efflux protein
MCTIQFVMENTIKENKLGVMPIGKLLASMSIPTMFSMLIQALYNIVDSIFVSQYSEKALTAVSLAYPMQNLMSAFAVGISVGICSVISRRLGEKDNEAAIRAADTGYTILLICIVAFMLIGAVFSEPFFRLYTEDEELIYMGTHYLKICLIVSVGCFLGIYSEKVLQSTGDTIHPMIIQLSGAIFNIIFDPIMIFGYFGCPAMGIDGAAYATVLGQILSMFVGAFYLKRNQYVKVKYFRIRFDKTACKDILQVGLPSVVMQGIGTVMTSLMNGILIAYDVIATTVFGVYFKLQSFIFMPVFGLNSGLMPILAYNYGAKNRERMMKALKLGLSVAFLIMVLGALAFILIPDVLLGLFNASENLLKIGEIALRRISYSFPIAAFIIVIGSLFQAMGDGYLSMITSIVRQIAILVPSAWILGKLFGLDAIWFSFIIAEVLAGVMNIFFVKKEMKKINF